MHPEDGRIDFIDNQVDMTTGTITVRGTVGNSTKTIIPGQYVKVKLLLKEQPGAVLVPSQAVGDQQGSTYVYVVGDDNKAEFRNVDAGTDYKGYRIINKGLKAGETVIVDGLQKVKPGATVKPETEQQAEAARKAQPTPGPDGGKSR